MRWRTKENAVAMMVCFGWRTVPTAFDDASASELECPGCRTRQVLAINTDGCWSIDSRLGPPSHPAGCIRTEPLRSMHEGGLHGLSNFIELLSASSEHGTLVDKEAAWKIKNEMRSLMLTVLREFYPEAADALEFPATYTRTEKETG